jgi:hypothetical protein
VRGPDVPDLRLPSSARDPELIDQLRPRVEGLGYLGEFSSCAASALTVLGAFVDLTTEAREVAGERLAEVVALTMAEDRQPPDVVLLSVAERAAQRLARAARTSFGRGTGPALAELARATDAHTSMAVLFLVGRHAAHGLVVSALELGPPVPSPAAGGTP